MNFAVKVVSAGYYRKRDHVTPLYTKLQWLTAENVIKLNTPLFVHKAPHNPAHPNDLELVLSRNRTHMNTRGSNLFDICRWQTELGKRAMSISGPMTWNTLPDEIKSVSSHNAIKSKRQTADTKHN